MFMLMASIMFSMMEKWSFADALYYTFITLTTIGLGDFVPGLALQIMHFPTSSVSSTRKAYRLLTVEFFCKILHKKGILLMIERRILL